MMFSNIFQRNSDINVDRFSSYKGASVKDEYDQIKEIGNIASYEAVIYEISKYDTNESDFEKNLELLVNELSKGKKVIVWHSNDDGKKGYDISKKLEKVLSQYKNCKYLNFDFLFDEINKDLYTYSTNFLNDAANIYIYKELDKNLRVDTWNI